MLGLRRYQVFLSYGILLSAIWYAAIQNKSILIKHVTSSMNYFQQKEQQHLTDEYDNNDNSNNIIASEHMMTVLVLLLIDYFPLVVVASLGIHALCSISIGILTLKDSEEASLELERSVVEAKEYLTGRGLKL
mmetsp:Transcript_8946/g.12733  ORF Transcript_8946/g.12733 Transcript_8946/m.12733 type:complete len:133 (+) Transcript_8946:216-614(+)